MSSFQDIAAKARQVRLASAAGSADVPSPCISVCIMDGATGWCQGCLRTIGEIAAWSGMDNLGKQRVWACMEDRAALVCAPVQVQGEREQP